jgi:hypothetical protein
MNLDALVKAIAYAETGYFTKGAGVTHKNGFGIMTWASGKRAFVRFETQEQSILAAKSLILRRYTGMTLERMSEVWTGKDNAQSWLKNVKYYYMRFAS